MTGGGWDFDRFDQTSTSLPPVQAGPGPTAAGIPSPTVSSVSATGTSGLESGTGGPGAGSGGPGGPGGFDTGWGAGSDGGAGAAAVGDALEVGKPPVFLLAVASAAALLAIVVGIVWGSAVPVSAVGWLVGGPVAIGVLAWFTIRDTRAQTSAVYSRPGWVSWAYRGGLVLCLVAILANALRIAYWVGTR